ncbi:MAG: hypothetical protein AAGK37_21915 [Pseudomonadota bacterium]
MDNGNIQAQGSAVEVTSLTAPGLRLTKTLILDGEWRKDEPAENGFEFTAEAHPFGSLEDIHDTLAALKDRADTILIHGSPTAGANTSCMRRLFSRTAVGRTIDDTPKLWCNLDIDGSYIDPAPENWRDDPFETARKAIRQAAPPAFHRKGCVIDYSASMLPQGGPVKLHAFFLLNRPLTSWQLKHWLGKEEGLDPSIFSCGQPIYTAAPICYDADGVILPDPLEYDRLLILDGPVVGVPDEIPDEPPEIPFADDGNDPEDIWLDPLPEEELLRRLDYTLKRCGRVNPDVPPSQMLGVHAAMYKLQFRYLVETYGRPRDKEWLRRQLETALRKNCPGEPEDYLQLNLGPKFDGAWRSGIAKAKVAALQPKVGIEDQIAAKNAKLAAALNPAPPEIDVAEHIDGVTISDLPLLARMFEQQGDVETAGAIRAHWREQRDA